MTGMPARTASEWSSFADTLASPRGLVIDGDVAAPLAGESRPLVSPRDGTTRLVTPWAGIEDMDRAVQSARHAFDQGSWPHVAPRERKETLLRWAALIEAHRDELSVLLALELGKPISQAWQVELQTVIRTYQWYAELADKELDEIAPSGEDALALVTREPVGVVGVVTPWNFPLTLSAWKIAPALAAGCTVVHKPSEITPLSAIRMAELALEAGLPEGVLNVVTGSGLELGRHLGEHHEVDSLAFTGSTAVGRAYLEYSARSNLKRTWLELGGKSPNIILPDAPDLQIAISTAAWGIFFNSGQMCTAPSRLIVHEAIADEVVEGVLREAAAYAPGDPLDPATVMGPLASAERVADVRRHVEGALADGAALALGGGSPAVGQALSDGAYFEPTVFTDVSPDSALAREEVFGPVLAVIRVHDDDEAVRVANDSDYGLAAGLWTADASKVHRLSRRLRAGTIWVNCYEEGGPEVPFGGYKMSGNGRDKSRHAIDKYTELKTTYLKL